MSRGILTPQWTVWCNICEKWDMSCGSKAQCTKDFLASGWKKVKRKWMCPSCQKELTSFQNLNKLDTP